ncbi:MAG TPA: O-antigen ligase family protein [Gemmatimonadaceae bacterium]|jgi:O-antigen ligase
MSVVMILPFLVILNGIRIPVGASSIAADQLVACFLLVPLVASTLFGARRLHVDSTVGWLAAIVVWNVTASLLHSPALSYSLLQCANLASTWIIYLVVSNGIETREAFERFLRCVLWAALIASAVGIAAFCVALAGFDVGGAEVSTLAVTRLTQAYGAYGFMVEPNIFGSFAAAHFVLSMLIVRGGSRLSDDPRLTKLARRTAAFTFVALILSFTRAAWLGAAAGLLVAALLAPSMLGVRIRPTVIMKSLVAVVAIIGVLVLIPGNVGTVLRFKLVNLVNPQSQTVVVRLLTYGIALQQTMMHPFAGWGTFTFAPLLAEGSDFQRFDNWRSLWIGNYLLLALHDTGAIGLLCWVAMLWTVVARGLRAAREAAQAHALAALRSLGLTAAIVTLLIPFLATSGFSLGFPWLLFGLLGAHCRLQHAQEVPALDPETSPRETATPFSPPLPVPISIPAPDAT